MRTSSGKRNLILICPFRSNLVFFLLSLVLGSLFLDEYEVEISSLDKLEWGFQAERSFFIRAVYRSKYLKRRSTAMVILDHSTLLLWRTKEHVWVIVTWTRKLAPHKLLVLSRRKGRNFPIFFSKLNRPLLKVSLGFRCFIWLMVKWKPTTESAHHMSYTAV